MGPFSRMGGLRGGSLRGMGPFVGSSGMGATPIDWNALAQTFTAQVNSGQPLTLESLTSTVLQSDAGKGLVDSTMNAALDDPTLRPYLEERALSVVWERYKGVILLLVVLLVGAGYVAGSSNQKEQQ